jgi:hypothetical protein
MNFVYGICFTLNSQLGFKKFIEFFCHVLFDNQTWTNDLKLDFAKFGLNFENPQTCMTYIYHTQTQLYVLVQLT